jgi:hypothetical protein
MEGFELIAFSFGVGMGVYCFDGIWGACMDGMDGIAGIA